MAFTTTLQFSDFEPDFSTMMMMLHEYASDVMPNSLTRFPVLKYRRFTTPTSQHTDSLHTESLPANEQFVEYDLPIYVSAQPKRQELSKFGIDEPRDLLIYIALPVLEENGLVVQKNRQIVVGGIEQDDPEDTGDHGPLLFLCRPGDRVFFQGHQYVCLTSYEDQFFANSEIPTWLVFACQKWQPDTTTDTTLNDTDAEWREDPLNPENDL